MTSPESHSELWILANLNNVQGGGSGNNIRFEDGRLQPGQLAKEFFSKAFGTISVSLPLGNVLPVRSDSGF